MIDTTPSNPDRLDHLLADRALFGVSPSEQREIESLCALFPHIDADCYDRIAATVDLALSGGRFEPMPDWLQEGVRQRAREEFADRPVSNGDATPSNWARKRESVAWVVAVAATVALVVAWFSSGVGNEKAPSVAELRARTIHDSDGLVQVAWQTTGDAAAETTSGDVVWDNATQRGYMRFRDLQKNPPDEYQYQLWIFDAERDDRYPIDGGVFDVDVERGEAIVPIRAKLKVLRPAMFAVTVEKPGGVVVSNRERICLVAKLEG